ncbi:MAG: hypothetical protein FWC11_04930, partial [Firmicutes bacterium]|nr:hypothetical protein [Bacillota bacterium]
MKKLKLTLMVVVLALVMAMSVIMLTACPDSEDDHTYHSVTWSATGASVTASFAGQSITNGASVRDNSNVVFEWQQPAEGYRMRITIGDSAPTYHLRVVTSFTHNVRNDVSIVFAVVPEPTLGNFTITWTGPIVMAAVGASPIASGDTVLENSSVLFAWVAPAVGRRMRIVVADNAPIFHTREVTSFVHLVTEDVSISFEVVPVEFTMTWRTPENFTVNAQVSGNVIQSDDSVAHGSNVLFVWGALPTNNQLRIIAEDIDVNLVRVGAGSWILPNITQDLLVEFTLEFIPPPNFTVNWVGEGVSASVLGNPISLGAEFPQGSNIAFTWGQPAVGYRMKITVGDGPAIYRDRDVTTWTLSNLTHNVVVTFVESVIPTETHQVLIDAGFADDIGVAYFSVRDYSGNPISSGANIIRGTTLVITFEILPGFMGIFSLNVGLLEVEVFPTAFPHGEHTIHHTLNFDLALSVDTWDFEFPADTLYLIFFFSGLDVWERAIFLGPLGNELEVYQFSARQFDGTENVRLFEVYDEATAFELKPTFLVNLGAIGYAGGYVVIYHNNIFAGSRYAVEKVIRFMVVDHSNIFRTMIVEYIKTFDYIDAWADFVTTIRPELDILYLHPQFIGMMQNFLDYVVESFVAECTNVVYDDPARIRVIKMSCPNMAFEMARYFSIDAAVFTNLQLTVRLSDCGLIVFLGEQELVDALTAEFGARSVLNFEHLVGLRDIYDFMSGRQGISFREIFFRHPAWANWVEYRDYMEEVISIMHHQLGQMVGEVWVYYFNCSNRALEYLTRQRRGNDDIFTMGISDCGYIFVMGTGNVTYDVINQFNLTIFEIPVLVGNWRVLGSPEFLLAGTTIHITYAGIITWRVNNNIARVGVINAFNPGLQLVEWTWFAQGFSNIETFVRFLDLFDILLFEVNFADEHIAQEFVLFDWVNPDACLVCEEYPCICLRLDVQHGTLDASIFIISVGGETVQDGDLLVAGTNLNIFWQSPAGYDVTLLINGIPRTGISAGEFGGQIFNFQVPTTGPVFVVFSYTAIDVLPGIPVNISGLDEAYFGIYILGLFPMELLRDGDRIDTGRIIVVEWENIIVGYTVALTINGYSFSPNVESSGMFSVAWQFYVHEGVTYLDVVFVKTPSGVVAPADVS